MDANRYASLQKWRKKFMSRVKNQWWEEEISELGAMIMQQRGPNYCIEDAIDKFEDEISYWDSKIRECDTGFAELYRMQLMDPIGLDYESELSTLSAKKIAAEETKTMLERDLDSLLGRVAPWDE